MRVFVTGSTGFIGSALMPELIAAGHTVLGLTRSDEGAKALEAAGATAHRGDIYDLESIRSGAAQADAVIHLAFNHDFSKFAENCETDRKLIDALTDELAGSNKLMIITSGTAISGPTDARPGNEDDPPMSSTMFPRAASEEAANAAVDRGVRVAIIRLPQVHDTRKQGLVTYAIEVARQKGISAYVGEGKNRWPAAHISDVAHLYRLALEKTSKHAVYNAVAEEGISMREIAEVLGQGLKVPVKSLPPEEVPGHFGWLAHFVSWDLPSSSEKTRKALGWNPTGPDMLTDLKNMQY